MQEYLKQLRLSENDEQYWLLKALYLIVKQFVVQNLKLDTKQAVSSGLPGKVLMPLLYLWEDTHNCLAVSVRSLN